MPRGAQTSFDKIEAIHASYAVTGNASQTARDLNIPITTVCHHLRAAPDIFAKYRRLKRIEFIEELHEIQTLLIKRLKELLPQCDDAGKVGYVLSCVAEKRVHAIGMRDPSSDGVESQTNNNMLVITAEQIHDAIKNHQAERNKSGGNGTGQNRVSGVPALCR